MLVEREKAQNTRERKQRERGRETARRERDDEESEKVKRECESTKNLFLSLFCYGFRKQSQSRGTAVTIV